VPAPLAAGRAPSAVWLRCRQRRPRQPGAVPNPEAPPGATSRGAAGRQLHTRGARGRHATRPQVRFPALQSLQMHTCHFHHVSDIAACMTPSGFALLRVVLPGDWQPQEVSCYPYRIAWYVATCRMFVTNCVLCCAVLCCAGGCQASAAGLPARAVWSRLWQSHQRGCSHCCLATWQPHSSHLHWQQQRSR
jgi:hypothetical protein